MAERTSFARQPARILVVHLISANDVEMCRRLVTALGNLFSLICSMSGPCKLPFVGVLAISGSQPEILMPLQNVRSNFPRIHSALNELKNMADRVALKDFSCDDDLSAIQVAVQDAVAMFQRQAQGLLQAAGYMSQLEITLFTTSSSSSVIHAAESAIASLEQQHSVKRIQVVCVKGLNPLNITGDDDLMTAASSQLTDSESTASSGLVDLLTIDIHPISLQSFVVGWLHESSTDVEHLHLVFPAAETADDLVIKCDIQERILNTFCLPFYQNYNLSTTDMLPPRPAPVSGKSAKPNSTYRLVVVGRLPSEAVCESLVFGNPLILCATSCWKIDWDELESNQQSFYSLCSLLRRQGSVLIVKLLSDDNVQPAATNYYSSTAVPPPPSGHFVIMPSPNCSLLIKSLAVSELMLPAEFPSLEQFADLKVPLVSDALLKVELLDTYNPLVIHSGLYESLQFQLTRSLPGGRRTAPPTQFTSDAPVRPKTSFVRGVAAVAEDRSRPCQLQPKRLKTSGRELYGGSDFPSQL